MTLKGMLTARILEKIQQENKVVVIYRARQTGKITISHFLPGTSQFPNSF